MTGDIIRSGTRFMWCSYRIMVSSLWKWTENRGILSLLSMGKCHYNPASLPKLLKTDRLTLSQWYCPPPFESQTALPNVSWVLWATSRVDRLGCPAATGYGDCNEGMNWGLKQANLWLRLWSGCQGTDHLWRDLQPSIWPTTKLPANQPSLF